MKRQLILENGAIFVGTGFGGNDLSDGEVVFNTGMTGYQETLSDPSYCDQIVTLTYPLIGNYGINRDDFESINPAIAGLIVKEAAEMPSHWRSEQSLHQLLADKNIPGLKGIDTRRLTKMIREYGTLRGRLCAMDADVEAVVEELKQLEMPTNQIQKVSTKVSYASPGNGPRVVLVDFGAKKGILRDLIKQGFDCLVAPYHSTAEEILRMQPDGVMLSNGPGDPKDVPEALDMIRGILGKVPVFGICMGHQLLALACGGNTEKMRFGHRGANHPVKDLITGKFMMTSQNHGYTVQKDSLEESGLDITHIAINDVTVEGLKHTTYSAFSVQFHPEASPGPEDSAGLFDQFKNEIKAFKKAGVQYA
ncbi:carbamoyl-phosphate synthase small subunit [Scopulibacillus darangshiensis]|uniref:Carbamoyl phosphate synthase small chain n=1 Tax=Scopulibacillus darangshiensis TaxID=442528 RepID=A0A4V2SMY5_9BACL|nr:carbamoyl phosphate synthase small subunit [Scopulibacillus darangshiensis]TCP29116.1 carbamoyl-phosphate synthase small subunit [Scopulibacillus darangshiensis]